MVVPTHPELDLQEDLEHRGIGLGDVFALPEMTKQRAHQIAEEKGFPAPFAEDARGRVWSRYEVQAWAKRWR